MNEKKSSNAIQTYKGLKFYPLNARLEDIDINDIAHALSNICRFLGHCKKFYSVAQHCVLVSHLVPKKYQLQALLHDASEAYLCDIPSPIKPHIINYFKIEENLMFKIAEKFNFNWPVSKKVHEIDKRIILNEEKSLLSKSISEPTNRKPIKNLIISPVSPKKAEYEFLKRYEQLRNR